MRKSELKLALLKNLLGSKPLKLVIFDLDGTLVDSVSDLKCALDLMHLELNMATASIEQVRAWVGNGAELLVRRALSYRLDVDVSDGVGLEIGLFETAYASFLRHYALVNGQSSSCYDGALSLIERLKSEGIRVSIVTNKPSRFTLPLLKKLSISVDVVVSGDTLVRKKPDPMPLNECLRQLGVPAENAVMVGDSVNDISAAKAANIASVAVSYGYNHGIPMSSCPADRHVDSLLELQ